MTMIRALTALVLLMANTTPSGQPLPKQPSDYTPAAQSQVVSWQLKRLAPPSALYVGVDDVLRIGAASNQANEVVTVNYRLLRAADGVVVPGQFTVSTLNSAALTNQDKQLAEGFLLSASCQAKVAGTRGQTFARLYLNPKSLGTGQPAQQLMADYVTTAMAPGYPNGRVTSPQEGPGWIHAVQATSPPRGHDWGGASSLLARRREISVTATLTTSATAGNRTVQFQVLNNLLNIIGWFPPGNAQSPNSAVNYTASAAPVIPVPIGTPIEIPLPPELILPAGYSVQVTTVGLDTNAATGDVWTNIWETVEEWLDNV